MFEEGVVAVPEEESEREEVEELGKSFLFPVEVDPQAVFPAHLPAAGEVREPLEPVQVLRELRLRRSLLFFCLFPS